MTTRYKVAILVICSCGLASCGSVIETKQQTDQAAILLEKDLGVRPQIGFNIFNGKLAAVTVVFESDKLKDMPISELELRVHRILAAALDQKPEQIIVSLQSSGLKGNIKQPMPRDAAGKKVER